MLLTYLLTYCLEQSPSWEANRFAAIEEFPCILLNLNIHYLIQSARHLSLSWASSIQAMPPHPLTDDPKWSLSFRFSHQTPVYVSPPLHTRHTPLPSHFFDFNTRTIFGEECKSLSSTLCSFLLCSDTASLSGTNILYIYNRWKSYWSDTHCYVKEVQFHWPLATNRPRATSCSVPVQTGLRLRNKKL